MAKKPYPNALERLTDEFIFGDKKKGTHGVKKKGTYCDGGNLYLQVGIGGGAKSWMFIYSRSRLLAESSLPALIAALEAAGQPIPPKSKQWSRVLDKLAYTIVKEHKRAVEAHHQLMKAYAAAAKAAEQGLLRVPVSDPGEPPQKTNLITIAEQFVEDRRQAYVGLGSLVDVPPDVARKKAAECRAMLAENPPRDPRRVFNQRKQEAAQRNARTKLFKQMVLDYLDFRTADPDKPMHIATRKSLEYNLNKYLVSLHGLYPAQITAVEVFNIIQPLRIKGRRTTAHICRTFLYQIFQWAKGQGAFPLQEWNPASLEEGAPLRLLMLTDSTDPKRFAQALKSLHFTKVPALFKRLLNIPRRTRLTIGEAARAVNKTRHTVYNSIRHGRLKATKPDRPYSSRSMDDWEIEPEDLAECWTIVRKVIPGLPNVALFALMFQVLTISRPFESLGARWDEWDEKMAVWRIPWQRIKGGGRERKDFFVPLSPEATAILQMLREHQQREGFWKPTGFIFGTYYTATKTSGRIGIPPCRSTLKSLLEKNVDNVDIDKTLHGFRTSFSSWAKRVGFKEMDVERALKHKRGFGSTNDAILYSRDAYNDEDADPEMIAAFNDDPLREMLEVWAFYLASGEMPEGYQLRKPADVVRLGRVRRESILRILPGSDEDQTTTK